MSRILKRPMFRSGGSSNEGIMHGLVNRQGYANGTEAERYRDEYMKMLAEVQPAKPKFNMGRMGLNLISGQYAGDGLLQNIAGSAQDPYAAFTAADDARGGLDYQKKLMATKMGISRAEAEELARRKAAGSGIQKDYSDQRAYETAVEKRLEARSKMSDYQDLPVDLAFIRETAEYDILVLRNLRTTQDPKGREINALKKGFVPYDEATGEFDYMAMDAGAYYYDPDERVFVQKIPTTTNEAGETVRGAFYAYDKFTFEKRKLADLPE